MFMMELSSLELAAVMLTVYGSTIGSLGAYYCLASRHEKNINKEMSELGFYLYKE